MAREDVKALKKDVLAKCYGGDISRKMKLLKHQAEGKKKMKKFGNIEINKDMGNIGNRDRFGIDGPLTSLDFERQVVAAAKRWNQKTFKPEAKFEGLAGKKSDSM